MGAVLLVDGLVRAAMGFTLLSGLGRCFVGPIILDSFNIPAALSRFAQTINPWLVNRCGLSFDLCVLMTCSGALLFESVRSACFVACSKE